MSEIFQLSDDINVENASCVSINKSLQYRHPNIIDHRDFCLPTNDQGTMPNCVGYTVAAFFEIKYWKHFHVPVQFPAQKIYQLGRKYKCDSIAGTRIEYCLESLKSLNVFDGEIYKFCCDENDYCDFKCMLHECDSLMCAFTITDEWYSLNRKYIIKEKSNPKKLGGHCVLCCGYCDDGIYIQNSWGYKNWGNYGFGLLPWNLVYKQLNYTVAIRNFNLNENAMEIFLSETKDSTGNN